MRSPFRMLATLTVLLLLLLVLLPGRSEVRREALMQFVMSADTERFVLFTGALEDEDPRVVVVALEGLGWSEDPAHRKLVEGFLGHPNADVREEAERSSLHNFHIYRQDASFRRQSSRADRHTNFDHLPNPCRLPILDEKIPDLELFAPSPPAPVPIPFVSLPLV